MNYLIRKTISDIFHKVGKKTPCQLRDAFTGRRLSEDCPICKQKEKWEKRKPIGDYWIEIGTNHLNVILKYKDGSIWSDPARAMSHLLKELKKERQKVLEEIKKRLRRKFGIDYVEIGGIKYVNAKQVQRQVIKVFQTLKKEK